MSSLYFTPTQLNIHGTFARLEYKSSHPVIPMVELALVKPSKKTPRGLAFADNQDVVMRSPNIGPGEDLLDPWDHHECTLGFVKPGQECWYVLSIGDYGWPDKVYNYVGKFKTHMRRLDINFEKIRMINDSDESGSGDFQFGFLVNSDGFPNNVPLLYPSGAGQLGDGPTVNIDSHTKVHPNKSAVMWPYAGGSPWGESVHLTVNALDNDDDVFPADTDYNAFGNKSWGLLNPAMGTGSNDAWDWLQGETTLNVHKPGDFEDHTVPFTIYANGKDKVDMHYQVLGTVKVSHPTPKGGGVITEFPPGPLGLGYTPEFGLAGDDEDLAAVPTKDGVYSFTLINADTNKAIKTLSNGTVVDFSVIGTNDLSVRANTNPDTVGSFVLAMTENLTTKPKTPIRML